MRVAVAGGTGVVGRHTVAALARAGHEPVVLSRSHGVDLESGAGLDSALDGVAAVVDVTNKETLRRRAATAFFTATTGRLVEAGRRAGVRHHLLLSIVGVDRVPAGYYRAKWAQEQLLQDSGTAWTVLRTTQFHEFAQQVLARNRGPVALVPRMRIRPVAAAEVGERLASLVTEEPALRVPDLAGPQVHDLPTLSRRVAAAQGRPRHVLAVRLPGRAGSAMASGGLLPGDSATSGRVTFDEWLRGLSR